MIKIAGLCSGHDCSYAILENGIPVLHNELERFTREKEPIGDSLEFLFNSYANYKDIQYFSHCFDTWSGGIENRYPDSFKKMSEIYTNNRGKYIVQGHHESHAANAFFSSNFDQALIVTIDGGGREFGPNNEEIITSFTVWEGYENKIQKIEVIPDNIINIGVFWSYCTKYIFNLSNGYPKGNQSGTVMAMACMGDNNKYYNDFFEASKNGFHHFDYQKYAMIAGSSEEEKFHVAAALQKVTEDTVKNIISYYLAKFPNKYLCLSGGVVLNSVMIGKMYEWFPSVKDIYVCPVPYDAGLAIGSAQHVWHQILNQPRVKWYDNATPYLGVEYGKDIVLDTMSTKNITYQNVNDDYVIDLLINGNIVAVFGGGSESGRRALGNRSILANPTISSMKDTINEKVKHRQWFRPFAPSILREEVYKWFVKDVNSPYMTCVIQFKEDMKHLVPAVVHFDGTARLQTVTEKDNYWYYNFIKKFYQKSNVPILLNTSFNDREPIVETPEHAINCFHGTNIDYLYFRDFGYLISNDKK